MAEDKKPDEKPEPIKMDPTIVTDASGVPEVGEVMAIDLVNGSTMLVPSGQAKPDEEGNFLFKARDCVTLQIRPEQNNKLEVFMHRFDQTMYMSSFIVVPKASIVLMRDVRNPAMVKQFKETKGGVVLN